MLRDRCTGKNSLPLTICWIWCQKFPNTVGLLRWIEKKIYLFVQKKNYKTSNLQISKLQIKNIEHENEFQWSQQARTHEYMQPSKRILLMIWQNWTNGFITFKYTAQSQQKWQHKLTSSTTRTRNLSSFKICFSCIRHKLPIVATRICGGSAWFQSQA